MTLARCTIPPAGAAVEAACRHRAVLPVLETERLVLRAPDARDVEPAIAFYMSERAGMAGGVKSDRAEAWRAFAQVIGHWTLRGFGLFAVTEQAGDQILGLVGPINPEGWVEPEIGWIMFDGAEGKGYACEAAAAARTHAYRRLGWPTAVSYIDPANARSIALAERLGARRDPGAGHPFGPASCVVYRHPAPETLT